MGTRWAPKEGRLVDHWGTKVAKAVAGELSAEESGLVVNLASNEYFAVLDRKLPKRVTVVAPDFRVMTAPLDAPGDWAELVPHEAGRRITAA